MATVDEAKSSFKQLDSIKPNPITYPIRVSANELVYVAEGEGIYELRKFNATTQSWQKLFDYKNWQECNGFVDGQFVLFFGFEYGTLCHDKSKNIYYLYSDQGLLEINMLTKTMEI